MAENNYPQKLKILIVEDSPYIAARIRVLLSDEANHDFVGIARTVSRAMTMVSEKAPDVVILDIHLEPDGTGYNGIDMLKTLRMQFPDIVVMMLTNFSELQYRHKCMQLGAHYFFDKSNDFDKIPDTLKLLRQAS
ncbi:MAG TPA: response regulator transcription factor [Chitinophagales bacterium]|nr:response regulator transcription factor [Chitinophagales bacterium]